MKLRHALFGIDPKYKKNKKYASDESDLDDDWIVTHEGQLKEKEIEKAEKKFARDNEKLAEEGKKPHDESVLKERLETIKDDFKRLAKERGTKKANLKREKSTEKIEEMVDKLTDKVKAFKLQMIDRDETKEIALGTRLVRDCQQSCSLTNEFFHLVKLIILILGITVFNYGSSATYGATGLPQHGARQTTYLLKRFSRRLWSPSVRQNFFHSLVF